MHSKANTNINLDGLALKSTKMVSSFEHEEKLQKFENLQFPYS